MTPVWKSVMVGVCGVAVGAAVVLSDRQRGAPTAQLWEEALVFGAATAGIIVAVLKRKQ